MDEVKDEQKIVKLDGNSVTQEELNKKSEQKNIRIVQESEGSYKTLTRMNG